MIAKVSAANEQVFERVVGDIANKELAAAYARLLLYVRIKPHALALRCLGFHGWATERHGLESANEWTHKLMCMAEAEQL